MQIHLSDNFSKIEVLMSENSSITVQCGLWPSWSDLFEATKAKLTFSQLKELEELFRNENQLREFEIEDQVLKIRFANVASI
jgi:hypothetical protein